MTRHTPDSPRADALPADLAWPAERLAEARAVLADIAHHSDHLIRLACEILVRHGGTEQECRDARVLLLAVEACTPALPI